MEASEPKWGLYITLSKWICIYGVQNEQGLKETKTCSIVQLKYVKKLYTPLKNEIKMKLEVD